MVEKTWWKFQGKKCSDFVVVNVAASTSNLLKAHDVNASRDLVTPVTGLTFHADQSNPKKEHVFVSTVIVKQALRGEFTAAS